MTAALTNAAQSKRERIAYDLTSIARHYALIMDLVENYRREMALEYLAMR